MVWFYAHAASFTSHFLPPKPLRRLRPSNPQRHHPVGKVGEGISLSLDGQNRQFNRNSL
jgi:hypothetical protein